jgi:rabenosyn-5
MLPLKSLPKILKHASPHGAAGPSRLSSSNSITTTKAAAATTTTPNALAAIRFNDALETGSQVSSRSSAIESLEAEEKELRERLIVLEEQKFIVNEMLNDARKRRKFDEVQSLSLNVDDLTREVDSVNGQLAQLDFATAYGGGLPGTMSPLPKT